MPVCTRASSLADSIGELAGELAALPVPRPGRSSRDDQSVHDAGRRRDVRGRPPGRTRPRWPCIRRLAFIRNYLLRGGIRDGAPGLVVSAMNADHVFLKFAKLRELGALACSRSHIDTARTWRGGQNQVLLTVNGLRGIGQRAALVAHPDGELRRQGGRGPGAHSTRPADRNGPVGRVAAVAAAQAAAAGRDPRARSARRGRRRPCALDGERLEPRPPSSHRGAWIFT